MRREILHLEQLIEKISESGASGNGDSWYLSMLLQSLARKVAALDYIQDHTRDSRCEPVRRAAGAGRY